MGGTRDELFILAEPKTHLSGSEVTLEGVFLLTAWDLVGCVRVCGAAALGSLLIRTACGQGENRVNK